MIAGRSADAIRSELLSQLCPSGPAWPKSASSNLASLLMAFAIPAAQVETDLAALALEISPGTSTLLLSDYHQVLGQDPAGRDAQVLSTADLQALLQERWIGEGGQTIAYYESLGTPYGIAVTIEEPKPPVWGAFEWGAVQWAQPTLRFCWYVDLSEDNASLREAIELNAPADTSVFFRVNGVWV